MGRAIQVSDEADKKLRKFSTSEIPTVSETPLKWLDIIHRNLLRRILAQYPCQGGSYDGGRWPVLLWLHARWRPRRSGFVPYLVVALQNEIFK